MSLAASVEERAQALLDSMRQTPMRRGALSEQAWQVRGEISRVLVEQGVPPTLARRVAFQLVSKIRPKALGDEPVWREIGRVLQQEVACLKQRAGMGDQRINTALPKLSAIQIVEFLDELKQADRRIARTILHAAMNAAEPLAAGRRYLDEYRLVARRLREIDPAMARTIAAATFAAGAPLSKAIEHLERFESIIAKHQETPAMARMIARAVYRAK
jgi:hypothetical protein